MFILTWKTKRVSNLTFVYIMMYVWSNMKGWCDGGRILYASQQACMAYTSRGSSISFRTPDLWLSILNLNSVEERKWMHVFPKSLKASPPRWNRVKASHHATKHYGNMHACLEPSESSGADLFFALLLLLMVWEELDELLASSPHNVVALSLGNRASVVAGSASLFRFPYAMALVSFRYKYNENLPNDFRQMSFWRMRRSSQQASHECMHSLDTALLKQRQRSTRQEHSHSFDS
jgi:hypothetical protein